MATTTTERYLEAVGRRKTSIARVRLTPSKQEHVTINGKAIVEYFPTATLQATVREIFTKKNLGQTFDVSVKVVGGGIASQAEAIRHGIARALLKHDEALRLDLKKSGYLTRDPRMKERRKFGLKKARKAPQWSKR